MASKLYVIKKQVLNKYSMHDFEKFAFFRLYILLYEF